MTVDADLRPSPADLNYLARFQMEVSDFQYITKNMKNGKALRLTFTWKLDHPTLGLLGQSIRGCFITRRRNGKLHFHLPAHKIHGEYRNIGLITVDLEAAIIAHVEKSGHAEYIGQGVLNLPFEAQVPAELDPRLPSYINLTAPTPAPAQEKEEIVPNVTD